MSNETEWMPEMTGMIRTNRDEQNTFWEWERGYVEVVFSEGYRSSMRFLVHKIKDGHRLEKWKEY